jgi:hypothetical protein
MFDENHLAAWWGLLNADQQEAAVRFAETGTSNDDDWNLFVAGGGVGIPAIRWSFSEEGEPTFSMPEEVREFLLRKLAA